MISTLRPRADRSRGDARRRSPRPASRRGRAGAGRAGCRACRASGWSPRAARTRSSMRSRSVEVVGLLDPRALDLLLDVGAVREELVQRRVEQADRDRPARPSPRTAPRSRPAGAAAARRAPPSAPRRSSARIASTICSWRSSPKNMCSVRHRPMPSAPNSRAFARVLGRVGVRAHAERAQLVGPRRARARSARTTSGSTSGTSSVVMQPVVPSMAIRSPSLSTVSPTRTSPRRRSMCEVARAGHRRAAHAARDERRVRGLAALAREDPLAPRGSPRRRRPR